MAGTAEPQSVDELLREAYRLLSDGRPAEAVSRLQRVLLVEPENFEALHYMGIARGQQGLLDEAENFLRRALAVRPDHALARYHLGYVLYRKGNLEEARWNLEEALRLDPSLEGARRLLRESVGAVPLEALANFWARAASFTIDNAVLSLLLLPVLLTVFLPALREALRSVPPSPGLLWWRAEVEPLAAFYLNLSAFLLSILIYALPWAIWGRSPGMVALRLRLVGHGGARLAAWRPFVRWFVFHGYSGAAVPAPFLGIVGGVINFLLALVGFVLFVVNIILISATPRRQAVHDLAAGTFVVGRSLPAWLSLILIVGVLLVLGVLMGGAIFVALLAGR